VIVAVKTISRTEAASQIGLRAGRREARRLRDVAYREPRVGGPRLAKLPKGRALVAGVARVAESRPYDLRHAFCLSFLLKV